MASPTLSSTFEGRSDNYHEFMKHGYARLFIYFALFGMVTIGVGIFAFMSTKDIPVAVSLAFQPLNTCNYMNQFLRLFAVISLIQAFTQLALAYSLYKFNASFHYFSTIVMASAYILIMILELGVLVAGLIWLWSSSAAVYCKTNVATLYEHTDLFCQIVLGVYGFRAILGSAFVMYYGLCTAAKEATTHLFAPSAEEVESLVPSTDKRI